MGVERTERGWAGHFCCSQSCLFRRNTLLKYENKKIVVSTVGLMTLDNKYTFDQIGIGRYYETMAFKALENNEFDDGDVTKQIDFNSNWAIDKVDGELEANIMHEKVVDEISDKLQNGEM